MSRVTNNEGTVRKALVFVLSFAIQAAALSAPLVHTHPDDHATEHHGGRTMHAHWSGHSHSAHPLDSPALEPPDHDRAVFLTAFLAVAGFSLVTPSVPPVVFELPVPAESAAHRAVDIAHGHDPPYLQSLPSRAPPTFLS